ncbi:MAG TPA: phosphate ABC transporter permease subunit PstC [Ktedonobacteraceae bacterium]|nr:phosphate ABC transporter permease subunit PstC [Ktedonobacteraceae bacterium]
MATVQQVRKISGTSRKAHLADSVARSVFLICAVLLIAVIVSVFVFIGFNAFRVFTEGATVRDFFFTTSWDPTGNNDVNGNPHFGAGGLILGSIVITVFSVLIVIPLGIGMALSFTEIVPHRVANFLQPLIEIFAGMPSVVVGFLGLIVLVPFMQKVAAPFNGHLATAGFGWGTSILVLVIMILPTVISVSIDTLHAVPGSVREASLALGSTRWQMMARAVVPAAAPGLATAVVLGMARAIGETLAVSMVLAGSTLPKNLFSLLVFFQPNINITQAIVQDFAETSGASRDAYWTLAFILLVITLLFISVSRYLASRSVYR